MRKISRQRHGNAFCRFTLCLLGTATEFCNLHASPSCLHKSISCHPCFSKISQEMASVWIYNQLADRVLNKGVLYPKISHPGNLPKLMFCIQVELQSLTLDGIPLPCEDLGLEECTLPLPRDFTSIKVYIQELHIVSVALSTSSLLTSN